MSRRALALLGGAALLVCALAPLGAAPRATSTPAAFARGLGGLRVVLADVLYLRADALRRAGDLEGAREAYEALLEMDPADVAAVGFLADLFADEMLERAPDPQARLAWWHAARRQLERGIALRPEASRLYVKLALLYEFWEERWPELTPLLEAAFPPAQQRRHFREALMEAARLRKNVPGLGRIHLRFLARHLPDYAVSALAEGDRDGFEAAVRDAHELLSLRASEMARMLPYGEASQRDLRLHEVLRVSFEGITAAARALAAEDREAARRFAERLAALVGHDAPGVGRLLALLG